MNRKHESFLDLIIYQIYPKSFKDTNGDGIGDIKGVIEKLDYLCDLGINAIWLCPCYKSPNYDNGYDIADFRDISEDYGTLEDIKELIAEMHKRGMKLIMDLVPNHTSTEHKWFIESRKSKENPYSDYYYWFDTPPNDWQSMFLGSAWQYDEARQQYYLHSYAIEQADLNWDNPQVVKEMQDIVDFWVDLGVDGFRCDVIDQISKNFDGRNCFGPNLHKYINALFGREKTKHLFTVGECWADDIDEINRHIKEDRGELSTLFQFDHLDCGRIKDKKFDKVEPDLKFLRDTLAKWVLLAQKNDILYSIFTDNHDNGMLLSRVGSKKLRYESATMLAAMFYLTKGVPFIFQGQEFGVWDSNFPDISFFNDVESVNRYNTYLAEGASPAQAIEKVNFGSRDNARRPMAWDMGENGGFTSGDKTWIPLGSNIKEINLESDLKSEKSIFKFYKQLLKIRKENTAFTKGEFKVLSSDEDNFFVYQREFEGASFTVVCNFREASEINEKFLKGEKILSNYNNETNVFAPFETAVFKI